MIPDTTRELRQNHVATPSGRLQRTRPVYNLSFVNVPANVTIKFAFSRCAETHVVFQRIDTRLHH